MSKRPALEPLEEMYDAPSPAPKRAKVEDEEMESPQPDGATSNGHLMSPREQYRDKVDITGAYDEEHAELEEAGQLPTVTLDDEGVPSPRPLAPDSWGSLPW